MAGLGSLGNVGKRLGYSDITREAKVISAQYRRSVRQGNAVNESVTSRLSTMGSWAKGNLQEAARNEGRSSILGMAGSHAIRGAAWGGVIGGATSAAQGGSFWDGAKEGAWNGAMGWTAYRMGMKATGAKGLNPFRAQTNAAPGGMASAAGVMWRSTGGADASVSKQATAILSQRQRDGLARSMMNTTNKLRAQS